MWSVLRDILISSATAVKPVLVADFCVTINIFGPVLLKVPLGWIYVGQLVRLVFGITSRDLSYLDSGAQSALEERDYFVLSLATFGELVGDSLQEWGGFRVVVNY